jgi:hypothetical protein
MKELSALETEVMKMLLAGDDRALDVLRMQLKEAIVASRNMTGTGFYTTFSVPPSAPRIEGRPSFKLGDVDGAAVDVQNGFGFIVFITDGTLGMLEGYTYDEPWPDQIRGLRLSYAGTGIRRLEDVRARIYGAAGKT